MRERGRERGGEREGEREGGRERGHVAIPVHGCNGGYLLLVIGLCAA